MGHGPLFEAMCSHQSWVGSGKMTPRQMPARLPQPLPAVSKPSLEPPDQPPALPAHPQSSRTAPNPWTWNPGTSHSQSPDEGPFDPGSREPGVSHPWPGGTCIWLWEWGLVGLRTLRLPGQEESGLIRGPGSPQQATLGSAVLLAEGHNLISKLFELPGPG